MVRWTLCVWFGFVACLQATPTLLDPVFKPKKIIVSFDGGGIRGMIPATIINELEAKVRLLTHERDLRIGSCVDLFAGTSTGSILAGFLACPESETTSARRLSRDRGQQWVSIPEEETVCATQDTINAMDGAEEIQQGMSYYDSDSSLSEENPFLRQKNSDSQDSMEIFTEESPRTFETCTDIPDQQKVLCLRPKYDGAFMKGLIDQQAKGIFQRSFWRRCRSAFGLVDEKYSDKTLNALLEKHLGDVTLDDLVVPTLITTVALKDAKTQTLPIESKGCQPVKIRSYGHKKGVFETLLLRQAIAMSTAAPTYFEPEKLRDAQGQDRYFVDGGLGGNNNPARIAYDEALNLFKGLKKEEILLISVGTGKAPLNIDGKKARHWGLAQWAVPVVSLALDMPSKSVHQGMKHTFQECQQGYVRLQPKLEKPISLDDTSEESLKTMQDVCLTFCEDKKEVLERLSEILAWRYLKKKEEE